MRLNCLLEIARQCKRYNKPLNEKYLNKHLTTWQNQIWKGGYYNDSVKNENIPDISYRSVNHWRFSYAIRQIYITYYDRDDTFMDDKSKIDFKKAIQRLTTFDGYRSLFYSYIDEEKVIQNTPGIEQPLTQPLSVLIRDTLLKAKTLDESPLRNVKLTSITDDNLEVVPYADARKKQYKNYILFWTTEDDKLFAVSYNHIIFLTFNDTSTSARYGEDYYSFNRDMTEPISLDLLDDIPTQISEHKFANLVINLISPWYRRVKNESIMYGVNEVKERHSSNSTIILYSDDLTSMNFMCEKVGHVYGIDIDKIDNPNEREERRDYVAWLAKQKKSFDDQIEEYKQLVKRAKRVKECSNIQQKIPDIITLLFACQDVVFQIVSNSITIEDDDTHDWLKDLRYSYSNITYYDITLTLQQNLADAIEAILTILEKITQIEKFNDIRYSREKGTEVMAILSDINSVISTYNNHIRTVVREATLNNDYFKVAAKNVPAIALDCNKLDNTDMSMWTLPTV